MGIRTDIRDEIRKETITKIHGQPTSHDLTNLEKEIIASLANIPTTLGGGNYGSRWSNNGPNGLHHNINFICS